MPAAEPVTRDDAALMVQLATIAETMRQVAEAQKELTVAVRGNGKPGLLERMALVERAMSDHEAHCPLAPVVAELKKDQEKRESATTEKSKERRAFIIGIVMLILSTLVNLATSIFK